MPIRSDPWPAGTPCWVDLGAPDVAAAAITASGGTVLAEPSLVTTGGVDSLAATFVSMALLRGLAYLIVDCRDDAIDRERPRKDGPHTAGAIRLGTNAGARRTESPADLRLGVRVTDPDLDIGNAPVRLEKIERDL